MFSIEKCSSFYVWIVSNFFHSVISEDMLIFIPPNNDFYFISHRAQFEQLCASLLARVEPPLKAVMEQASK